MRRIEETETNAIALNLGDIFRERNVCLGPICLNTRQLTQEALKVALRDHIQANAPVAISTDRLYPVTNVSGQPAQLLDLASLPPDAILPPGRYAIPAQVFCMQARGSSPHGHRYQLAEMSGSRHEVLAALHQRGLEAGMSHSEIQGLSWLLQSGQRYPTPRCNCVSYI